jgi:hypothetical protein
MTAVHAVAGRISELAARDAALSDRMGEGAFSFGLSFLSGLSDGDSFQAVFGSVNMIRIQRDAGFPAETFGATRNPSRNDIEFYNSAFTRRGGFSEHLVLHELGHLFAGHANRQQPYGDLANGQIVTDGDQIAGGGIRTAQGYLPGQINRRPWQQNFRTTGTDFQISGEDFADMYLNWNLKSFASNPAGEARRRWMDSRMRGWTVLAVNGNQ